MSANSCAPDEYKSTEEFYPPMSAEYIYSNFANVDFDSYMRELDRRVKMNWDKPAYATAGETVLKFSVLKNGNIENLVVFKSSGDEVLDNTCVSAIELSVPFRPLPSEYKGASLDVQMTFDVGINKPLTHFTQD